MSIRSIWTIAAAGVAYAVFGLVFGNLSGAAASADARVAWRWVAWVVSAIVFGGHILLELLGQHRNRRITALCAASGAALGAFGLAVAANIHAASVGQRPATLIWSLLLWPALIAVPAFVAAVITADLLTRGRRALGR